MYLPAITLGYAVPDEDFDGTVHSVFQSALNLRLHASDTLLTLVASDEADLPQGIRVETPVDFYFEKISVGETGACRNSLLRFASLTIDLRRARRWKCDLPALKTDPGTPAVASAWAYVWDALNRRQKHSNAEIVAGELLNPGEVKPNIVSRKAGEAMRNLVSAARQFDLNTNSAVKTLIGLGSGLTPGGDDLLGGFVAGLWCTDGDQSRRTTFITGLGSAIRHHSRQTNDISRTYLYHAVRGQVSSLLANLAEAISRGEAPDQLAGVAEAAMQVGHTSGMDTVTGLLIGLATWTDSVPRN